MMKKITQLVAAGALLVAMSANAQTLTQDWKCTTDIPAIANARFGTGFGGKIYVNDMSSKTLYAFDGTQRETVGTSEAVAMGIAPDDAGNLIILNGWAGEGAMKSVKLWNHTTGDFTSIDITLPESVTAARMDALGHAVGDIFSETGGAVFFAGNTPGKTTNTAVAKIFIANGQQVVEKSKAIDTGITLDNTTIATALTDDPESDEIVFRVRGNRDFYYNNGTKWVAYTRVGNVSTGSGGDVFTVGGTLYTVEPAGATYYDGFQIVNRATNEVVATHEKEGTVSNSSSYGTSLTAEVIDETTVRIYQFQPGEFAAQYTFTLPAPKVIYLVGSIEGAGGWDQNAGLEVKETSTDVYEADFNACPGNNFKIATALGDWSTINIGFETDNANAVIGENAIKADGGAIRIEEGGSYHVVIDMSNAEAMTMTLTKKPISAYPDKFYVVGDIEGHSWDPSYGEAVLMPTEQEGVYKTAAKVTFHNDGGNAYFSFTTALGANNSDWSPVNNNQWGAKTGNTTLTNQGDASYFFSQETTLGYFGSEHNYIVANGSYYIDIDIINRVVTLYDGLSGVGSVKASAAKVYSLNGEIRVEGGNMTSIFNAAGQAVALNSADKAFNVARGMYIVVVDGKAQKVIVK
ncbi:MAG: hypothetical protein ACI31D_05910 [Candidatus Limisoma sp.]